MVTVQKIPPFMGTKFAKAPTGFQAAVFAAPHGTPYPNIDNRVYAKSGDHFRLALKEDSDWLDHWDFDLDGPLLPNKNFTACDLGNLATKPKSGAENRQLITAQTKKILAAGAIPLMFGGDDSTPIPFLAAFAGQSPITILQIDSHIDWRDERYGEKMGFSSTMRRASEMDHVWRIVQAGAHGLGSAREAEIMTAKQWGAHIIPGKDIHHHGIQSVLDHIPADSDCVIALDLDVLDLSEMQAVAYPSPGGMQFLQLTDLIAGVAKRARIAGFSMVEFMPQRDPTGVFGFTAARIAALVLGQIARQS